MTETTLDVTRNEDAGRYEIRVDDELAGFTEFTRDGRGRLVFRHTKVDPAFAGKGLGSALARGAMTDSAARGETVVPRCPFIVRFLQQNEVAGLAIDWPPAPKSSGSGGV